MRLSERIYRFLLKAYPPRYLRRYEEPMAQLFSDQLRDATSSRGLVRLWSRTLGDLLRTVPMQYFERLRPHGVFSLYNRAARRSIFFARYTAAGFGHDYITPEHLLLGVLREDAELRGWLTVEALEEIRRVIRVTGKPPRRTSLSVRLPLNHDCERILGLANQEAERAGAKQIMPRHVLAGIVSDGHTVAAELLRRFGVNLDRLRCGE
jgi:hypothetical protein